MMTITSSTRTIVLIVDIENGLLANDEDAESDPLEVVLVIDEKYHSSYDFTKFGDYLTSQIIMITEILLASTLMDSGKIRDIM